MMFAFDDSYEARTVLFYRVFAPALRSERMWGGILEVYEI